MAFKGKKPVQHAYLARVCLNNAFAEKNIELVGKPFLDLESALRPEWGDNMVTYRYTFGVYRLPVATPEEMRRVITDTFVSLYPDGKDCIRIYVAEDDGSDRAELMKSIYTGYYGADSYIALTSELAASIPFLRGRGALKALRMQNYLFAVDRGCGFTTLLNSFANYLRRMDIFDDSARRTLYSEYVVTKKEEDGGYTPDDLIENINDNSAKKEDSSVIGIDISCFLEDSDMSALRDFLNKLYKLQDRYVFVFRVPFLEKKALDNVARAISDVALLRVIEIPPLADCVLLESFWDEIRRLGYDIDTHVRDTFFARVQEEKRDGRFYGYKTVEKIAERMALLKAAHDAEEAAKGGSPNAGYIKASDVSGLLSEEPEEKTGYEALSELIGMEEITQRISEIVAQVKLALKNDRLDRPSIHMRFIGAPGTGKTTVARIVGQILREEGVLRKGAFLEYSARSLCAEYVGQTAVKTASICREAYGSVLFIDEAYALYEKGEHSNDYGKEALTTLISEMENHRDDMLVIMAGYTDEMETLMKGNIGLRSRMPYALTFKNYTRKQLYEIFMLNVRKHFDYSKELAEEASAYFDSLSDEYLNSKDFSNGRFVRNLYERTWSKAALRASLSGEETITLSREDFIKASSEKEFSEKLETKNRIGF